MWMIMIKQIHDPLRETENLQITPIVLCIPSDTAVLSIALLGLYHLF